MPERDLGLTAIAGSGAGALVGYLPGVSSAIASVVALPAVPGRSGARGFLVALRQVLLGRLHLLAR
jgi:putative membrane protein